MKKFAVHICLVSNQPLPNFLPIFEADFRPKKVILLVTPEMSKNADILQNIIKNRCQINEIQQISIKDEYNIALVENELVNLLADYKPDEVAVNITGGTKLMAIAAFNLAQESGYQCIYFTQDQSEIILFNPKKQPEILFQCQSPKLKIEDYLNLHGYKIEQIYEKHLTNKPNFIKHFIDNYDTYSEIVPKLNGAIGKMSDKDSEKYKELKLNLYDLKNKLNDNKFNTLLSIMQENDLGIAEENNFVFNNYDCRKFCGGGWFEDYVFDIAKEIKKEYSQQIQDVALNVKFNKGQSPNEIDIAILCNNVLYAIECKTVNFPYQQKDGKDIVYKLDSLKEIGGLNTKLALVSYFKTNTEYNNNNTIKQRAKDNNILPCAGKDDIKGLKTHLIKWLGLK